MTDVLETTDTLDESVEQPEIALPLDVEVTSKEEIKAEPTVKELTEHEKEAMARGWKPLEEFKGDPSEWKGAKAYLKDGERFASLISLQNDNKKMREAIGKLAEHNRKISELEYNKALNDLKSRQAEAAEIGDRSKVAELADKLIDLSKKQPEVEDVFAVDSQKDLEEQVQTAYKAFISENEWFKSKDPKFVDAITFAHNYDRQLRVNDPNLAPSEHLKLIEKATKERFSEVFNQKSTAANVAKVAIPSETGISVEDSKYLYNKLPSLHKTIVNELQRADKNFNVKSYYQQLKDIGEIK
jgi:hypothetical protein